MDERHPRADWQVKQKPVVKKDISYHQIGPTLQTMSLFDGVKVKVEYVVDSPQNSANSKTQVWSLMMFSFVIGSRLCLNCIEAPPDGVFVP